MSSTSAQSDSMLASELLKSCSSTKTSNISPIKEIPEHVVYDRLYDGPINLDHPLKSCGSGLVRDPRQVGTKRSDAIWRLRQRYSAHYRQISEHDPEAPWDCMTYKDLHTAYEWAERKVHEEHDKIDRQSNVSFLMKRTHDRLLTQKLTCSICQGIDRWPLPGYASCTAARREGPCNCVRCQLIAFASDMDNCWEFPAGLQHISLHEHEASILNYLHRLRIRRWSNQVTKAQE